MVGLSVHCTASVRKASCSTSAEIHRIETTEHFCTGSDSVKGHALDQHVLWHIIMDWQRALKPCKFPTFPCALISAINDTNGARGAGYFSIHTDDAIYITRARAAQKFSFYYPQAPRNAPR